MNDERDPLLLDHEVDGIRELDNQLPRWWVWLFHLTIVFAVVYFVYYHVWARGMTPHEVYALEMKAGNRLKDAALARFEATMAEREPSADATVIAGGRNTYANLCAPCHRHDGGGMVGPNLTDDHWIHGGGFTDNLKVIWNGVPEKGMVQWKGVLKPEEIHAVASYIYTLRGTDPPNPKPPETAGAAPAENIYE
jgi:cytochrome c oxidase cbb3-type subunit III